VSGLPNTGAGTPSTANAGSLALVASFLSLVMLAAALLVSRHRTA